MYDSIKREFETIKNMQIRFKDLIKKKEKELQKLSLLIDYVLNLEETNSENK